MGVSLSDRFIKIERLNMRPSSLQHPEEVGELEGLSATCIGSFYARANYYSEASFDVAQDHAQAAKFFSIDKAYRKRFPGCVDVDQMGGFVAAREEILFERAFAAVKEGRVKNILIVASGISPLAVRLRKSIEHQAFDSDVNVITTDLADPIWMQLSLCMKLMPTFNNKILFDDLDALNLEDWKKVSRRFAPGGVAIICEGLLGYFTLENVDTVLTNVGGVLRQHGGFFLTDIATREGVRKTLFQGDSKKLLDRFYDLAEVNPSDLAFQDSKECRELVKSKGMTASGVSLAAPHELYIPRNASVEDRAVLRQIFASKMCMDIRVTG